MHDLDALVNGGSKPKSKPQDNAPEAFEQGAYQRESYAWAQDVFFAYEHLDSKPSREKAGTAGRFALWKFARGNTEKFVESMLPKAMVQLEKGRNRAGDDYEVVEKEKRRVGELLELLDAAIVESQELLAERTRAVARQRDGGL